MFYFFEYKVYSVFYFMQDLRANSNLQSEDAYANFKKEKKKKKRKKTKMNGELDCDRFEIMNDELCWGIIDFRMLFTGFLALIIDLFADLTVEILFFAGSAGSLAGFSQVAVVRWVFAGIFGLFVCSGRIRRLLGRLLVSEDFDTGKSVPHICRCHCSCLLARS